MNSIQQTDDSASIRDSRELASRIHQLECEKLEQEVIAARRLNSWWMRTAKDVKITEWITALAAIIALIAAFWTGLFNSVREKLSAQADRLEVEKIHLNQHKDKLDAQIVEKEKELSQLKASILPYVQNDMAVQHLRSLNKSGLAVTFATDSSFNGVRVSIAREDGRGWSSRDINTVRIAALGEALQNVKKLRKLTTLRLYELELMPTEISLLTEHEDLNALILRRCGLTSNIFSNFNPHAKLKSLNLTSNNICDFKNCPTCINIRSLTLAQNPIDDDGLDTLIKAFPNLESLDLSRTRVTSAGLGKITGLRKLKNLEIFNRPITHEDCISLLECPSLAYLSLDKSNSSKLLEAAITKRGSKIQVIDSPLPRMWVEDDDW